MDTQEEIGSVIFDVDPYRNKLKGGIYRLLCLVTGKYYCGSTENIKQRFWDHRKNLRGNKHCNRHLQYAWNKYGENGFTFEVVEYCNEEKLISREQWYIDKTRCADDRFGFNLAPTAGNTKGCKHTEEAKRKNRERQVGKKWPSDYRERMTLSIERHRFKRFKIIDPQGETHEVNGIKRFCEIHHLNASKMSQMLKGKCTHVSGWHLPGTSGSFRVCKRTKETYRFLDPKGRLVEIEPQDFYRFAREHDLTGLQLRDVWYHRKSNHKGWCRFDRPDMYVTLLDPQGKEVIICKRWRVDFIKENGLNKSALAMLINGRAQSHKGWKLKSDAATNQTD